MNPTQLGLRVAGTIFGLVGVAHLARLLLQFQITLGSYHVPVWMNGIGFIVTGALCFWLWSLSLPAKPVTPVPPAKA